MIFVVAPSSAPASSSIDLPQSVISLQETDDLHKLIFHCLTAANGDFGNFAACMTESDEVPSGDDETAEAPAAPEKDPADPDCWKTNADTYSEHFAKGENRKFDLAGAKALCVEFGIRCGAVTCPGSGDDSCTVRRSTELKPSDSGEVSYTYTC